MTRSTRPILARALNRLRLLSDSCIWRPLARRIGPHINDLPFYHPNPGRIVMGRRVHVANTVFNSRSGTITLEDNVFFGHGCMVLAGTHDYHLHGADRHDAVPASGKDVVIQNGAFIASGVIVIGPCTIGADAVVCAGSLVRGDLPAGWICAGSPARPVRQIDFYANKGL